MAYTVGARGQVVIAKAIRERLGVRPGWQAVQRIVGDRVEIVFLPPEHDRSLAGSLRDHVRHWPSEDDWARTVDEAWSGAVDDERP